MLVHSTVMRVDGASSSEVISRHVAAISSQEIGSVLKSTVCTGRVPPPICSSENPLTWETGSSPHNIRFFTSMDMETLSGKSFEPYGRNVGADTIGTLSWKPTALGNLRSFQPLEINVPMVPSSDPSSFLSVISRQSPTAGIITGPVPEKL